MDEYTLKTRDWLDDRFRNVDERGVYRCHAPVYGFGPDVFALGIYKNTYAVLMELARLSAEYEINSVLDAGCAEGYTASLIRELFGFRVSVCDLSPEAVKRAGELYALAGFDADVQSMDGIENGAYDVVLCSETVEHVPDPRKALAELARIARKALIVTVPAANSPAEKAGYVPPSRPHTHLNIFTREELQEHAPPGSVRCIGNRFLDKVDSLFVKNGGIDVSGKPAVLAGAYKLARALAAPARALYGPWLAELLVRLDRLVCRMVPGNAHTYIAVTRLARPDRMKASKGPSGMLEFMLERHKVAPLHLPKNG